MDQFTVILRTNWTINLVSPLIPVLAMVIHRRMERFEALPWMGRLEVFFFFGLLVNWALLGMAVFWVRNLWLLDLTILPEGLFSLWVMDAITPLRLPRLFRLGAIGIMVTVSAWDGIRLGLDAKWVLAQIITSLLILAASLWRLKEYLIQDTSGSPYDRSVFWFLAAMTLEHATLLIFYPMNDIFLRQLSRDWVLVPWLARFSTGLALNLAFARTFLCPKPSSS